MSMLERFRFRSAGLLEAATSWADPHWWIWASLILFVLCVVHPVPLKLPDIHVYSFKAHVALWIRRGVLILFVGLVLLFPVTIYILFGALATTTSRAAAALFNAWALDQLKAYWTAPVAAIGIGLLTSVFWHRYADPFLSDFFRKYRVKQGEGEPSDVKKEAEKLKTLDYDPRPLYRPGHYFFGLDESRSPIYVADADFHNKMVAVLGPTGTGKGAIFQVVLDQAIDKGCRVFFIDPKDDDNIPYVMAEAAARNGRPFIYLDLNPDGQGHWHPFKGGNLRDRRSRMIGAFKLYSAGSDADVYKAAERRALDKCLAKTDGSLRQMLDFIETESGDKELSTLRDSLNEWGNIATFLPPKKNRGHSIEQSLRNNAVVYVRGSIDDDVVRLATRCYVQELTQEIKRLKLDLKGAHTLINADEIRFVMSKELVDSLATIRSCDTNIMCGTQAISDLRNVVDRDIDKEALQQSFAINCQIKLLYKAGDEDTAKWGEGLAGTTWIRTQAMEKTEVNRWGGEKWGENRTMKREEVPLISRNKLLMLPERVGVFYYPGKVATTLFSAYIPLKQRLKTWEKPKTADKRTDIDDHAGEAPDTSERGIDVTNL